MKISSFFLFTEREKFANDELTKTIYIQIFSENGIFFEFPYEEKNPGE